ncbi:hypothetical protein OAX78_00430 [Planctomycetota bacterium]|nr:hypothetical protein [Planctomycetota bacterium]
MGDWMDQRDLDGARDEDERWRARVRGFQRTYVDALAAVIGDYPGSRSEFAEAVLRCAIEATEGRNTPPNTKLPEWAVRIYGVNVARDIRRGDTGRTQ